MPELPKKLTDGSVVISGKQARLHKDSEWLAVLVGAPLLLWVGTRERALNQAERGGVLALAVGTIVVDGYLQRQYRKIKNSK